jgi:hypothetical protein
MQNRKILGAMLAASLSLTTLASCATGVGAGATVGQKAPASSGANMVTAAGNLGPASTGNAAVAQGAGSVNNMAFMSADASAATAQALSSERAMDDYSVSVDEKLVAPYYTLAALSGDASTSVAVSGSGSGTSGSATVAATSAAKVDSSAGDGDGSAVPGSERSATGAAHANDRNEHRGGGRADDGATGANGKSDDSARGGHRRGAGHIDAAVKAKLEGRREGAKNRAAKRLKADETNSLKNAAKKAAWTTNADGTKTKTIEVDVTLTANAKTQTRHVKMERTVNAEGVLAMEVNDFSETLADHASRTSHREKTLNADGSYTVTFTSTITFADKSTRTATWNKTIGAEGGVTGTGTITWTDSKGLVTKTVKITLGGSEDAQAANAGDDKKPAVTADDDKNDDHNDQGDKDKETKDDAPASAPPVVPAVAATAAATVTAAATAAATTTAAATAAATTTTTTTTH